MVKQAGAGGAASGSAVAGLAVAAAVVAVGGLVWYVQRPEVPVAPVALLSPQAPTQTQTPTAPSQAPASVEAQVAPAFDTVRVTPEGQALVAGRAGPGTEVQLRVDGAAVARVTADGQGAFVALFDLPPSEAPRLLTLVQLGEPEVAGRDSVALAPTTAPVVAQAPEDPAPQAAPEAPPAAPAPLLVSDQGASVLQAALPSGSVSIASIAYTPGGGVQLAGQGDGGAVVRLYLDNEPAAESLVAASGQWFTTLRDIAPGLHTLRADQLDAEGKVVARFETPFLRETPEALAAALKPQAMPGQPRVAVSGSAAAPAQSALPHPVQAAPSPQVASPQIAMPEVAPLTVTVQPGFTLWRIARESFGDGVMYVKVFEANKAQIRNPDLIYPGQVFTIPE